MPIFFLYSQIGWSSEFSVEVSSFVPVVFLQAWVVCFRWGPGVDGCHVARLRALTSAKFATWRDVLRCVEQTCSQIFA